MVPYLRAMGVKVTAQPITLEDVLIGFRLDISDGQSQTICAGVTSYRNGSIVLITSGLG